jgi:hypothetical protein
MEAAITWNMANRGSNRLGYVVYHIRAHEQLETLEQCRPLHAQPLVYMGPEL